MAERPDINPGEWINVASIDCVVCVVHPPSDSFSDCEVVFDRYMPTNRDVKWTEDKWEFVETGGFGGHADKYPRLRNYVKTLRRGRN